MTIDHSCSADPGGYPINPGVSVPVLVARASSGVHGHCLLGSTWAVASRTLMLSLAMGLACQRWTGQWNLIGPEFFMKKNQHKMRLKSLLQVWQFFHFGSFHHVFTTFFHFHFFHSFGILPQKAALAKWKMVKDWMIIMIAEGLMWVEAAETVQSGSEKLRK